MAGELTIVAADVRPVEIIEQITLPAGADIDAGTYCRIDSNGKIVKAQATTLPNCKRGGYALKSVKAGMPVTLLRKGKIALGSCLDAIALATVLYASDTAGATATAAGTVSFELGQIEPLWADKTPLKVLRVDL